MNALLLLYLMIALVYVLWSNSKPQAPHPPTAEEIAKNLSKLMDRFNKIVVQDEKQDSITKNLFESRKKLIEISKSTVSVKSNSKKKILLKKNKDSNLFRLETVTKSYSVETNKNIFEDDAPDLTAR